MAKEIEFSFGKLQVERVHFKNTREVINFIEFKYKPTTYGKGGIFSTGRSEERRVGKEC